MKRVLLIALAATAGAAGCDRVQPDDATLPTEAQVREMYAEHRGIAEIEVRGNVVALTVRQPARQLERGGAIWARVGPYVYLFSPDTRDLFARFPAVAAVRVSTRVQGEEIARATLRRDALSEVRWRRSLNLLGHALREGRENPRRLEQLVEWGEEHAEFEYAPRYRH